MRALPWPDASADAVLLLGPLYHLTDPADRRRALTEIRRVLRPGGVVFAAAICRFAPLLEGFFADEAFRPVLDRGNVGRSPRTAPDALVRQSLRGATARPGGRAAGEGARPTGDCQVSGDPRRREALLELARATERDPMSLAVSPHILGIDRK